MVFATMNVRHARANASLYLYEDPFEAGRRSIRQNPESVIQNMALDATATGMKT